MDDAARHSYVVVASNPGRHPYVDAVRPPLGSGVRTVDLGPGFWDVAALDRAAVRVVHLHFGFEHLSIAGLDRWLGELRDADIALVHTVHDLANPHLVDQRTFDQQVGSIVRSADAVITLTSGAANEVERRFDRLALVSAHPPIFSGCPGPPEQRPVAVTTNLGQLRPNIDLAVVEQVASGIASAGAGAMTVYVRGDAVERAGRPERTQLERIASTPGVALHVETRSSDAVLQARLRGARVVLLPYRWGTHSGMLEAALDCGATPLAPTSGHYGEQGALLYADGFDAARTAAAVATRAGPVTTSDQCSALSKSGRRRQQRFARAADLHAQTYGRVARLHDQLALANLEPVI